MKKFSNSVYGYSKEEVNNFVAEVTKEYESMLDKLKGRDIEIHELKQKLLQYQNMENTLNRALMVAEDTSNQIKRIARDESKSIIEDAKRNASRIVNDALIRAEKLEAEGEDLRRRIVAFKNRFRTIVKIELENIEQIDEHY